MIAGFFNKSTLDNYSLKELMELYTTYARPKYFKEHSNMEEILNYISSYIMEHLSNNYFLNIMDLYTKLMVELIDLEQVNESNDSIIRIRNDKLENEFFLEMSAKSFGKDKDSYIRDYKKELDHFKEDSVLYKKILELLDSFQKNILTYLNLYTEQLTITERDSILKEIKKVIEQNSLEIIKRIKLRQDKKRIELESKFKELPISQIYDNLDTTFLREQNYVYKNFQSILEDLYKKNQK